METLGPPTPNQNQSNPEAASAMTLQTRIPDKSIVSSQLSLLEQQVYIDYDELEDYLRWIDQFPPEKVINKGALLTANNLSAEKSDAWRQISQDGQVHSMGECIEQKICTCFQRSAMFNLLMNQRDIPCVTLDGRVIETDRAVLHEDTKIAPLLHRDVLGLDETAFEDDHVWNVAQQGEKYVLVDTAFMIEGKPVIQEIPFDSTVRNTVTLQLSNGRYRHYLSSGELNVETATV